MELFIKQNRNNSELKGSYGITGLNAQMPRVTFAAPHFLKFEMIRIDDNTKAELNIRMKPDDMGKFVTRFVEVFEDYTDDGTIAMQTEDVDFVLSGPRNEMEQIENLLSESWDKYMNPQKYR